MKKYDDFIISIPALGIKKGDIVYKEDKVFKFEKNGCEVPSYIKMDATTISEHPYLRKYDNGTLVVPNPGALYSKFPGGLYVITDFLVKENRYVITSVNDKSKVANVSDKKFKLADIYYFLDSKGRVQMSYTGKDAEADEWRNVSHNMFKSKEDADSYKNEIIAKWVTCIG
jgi:hypothetical protein